MLRRIGYIALDALVFGSTFISLSWLVDDMGWVNILP